MAGGDSRRRPWGYAMSVALGLIVLAGIGLRTERPGMSAAESSSDDPAPTQRAESRQAVESPPRDDRGRSGSRDPSLVRTPELSKEHALLERERASLDRHQEQLNWAPAASRGHRLLSASTARLEQRVQQRERLIEHLERQL